MSKKIFTALNAEQIQNEFTGRAYSGYTLTDWVKIDGKKVHIAMVETAGKILTYVNGQLQDESEVG